MKIGAPGSFGAQLRALREAAGYTQEELAAIAGVSAHAISALERGARRRPHVETVRALSAALDVAGGNRDALVESARQPAHGTAVEELSGATLPTPLTPLLGREADVDILQRWLADDGVRLITLIGPGGVGKTRLALELARTIGESRSTRVVFVPLAAIRDPAFVPSAVAEALGLADVTAVDLPRRAHLACEGHRTFLVLDNFEHVLEAAPLVASLLTSVTSLRLLVTSRAALRVRGERQYAVVPLALADDTDAMSSEDLARSPAVRLFVERVRDVNPGFSLTSTNGPTVAAICRRLDALPLALELVAPWMKVLTAENLLGRLGRDVLLTNAVPRDLPERQRTITATVAWSYQLLAANERRAFRRLGALPGRFSIDAAAAVLDDRGDPSRASQDAVTVVLALIDKSLLLRAEGSLTSRPLYQMLETVRAYAALELNTAGESDEVLERLAHFCTGEAALAAEGLVGPAQREWLDRVRDDLDNYRAVLARLIESQRAIEASAMAWALRYFWLIRGHATEGLQWYEQILNLPSLPVAAESRALAGATVLWYTQGRLERARDGLTRAQALTHEGGDPVVIAQTEYLFGHVEHASGNLSAARDRFARSVGMFRALRMRSGTGNALSGLAALALAAGDADGAERLLDEAASELRHAGPWFLTWALYVRSVLAVRRGRPDQAIAMIGESLTRIRDLHDKFAFVYALVPLASAAVLLGDDAWAARIVGVRDAVTERTGVTVVDTSVQDLREHAERDARVRLGPDRWARAYAAGRVASIDSLIEDIDGVSRRRADLA